MQDSFSEMSRNDIKFRNGDGSFEEPKYNWEGEIVDEERELSRNSDIDLVSFWNYEASPSSQVYYDMMKNKSE
jgi:hypothetical protein